MRVQQLLGDYKGYVHDVFVHRYGFGNRTRSAHRSFRLIRRGRELAEMKNKERKFYAIHHITTESIISTTYMKVPTIY